jgi:PI-3-kinase-related kinase SMG-1
MRNIGITSQEMVFPVFTLCCCSDNDWLQDMFCSCWPLHPSPRTPDEDKEVYVFGNLALASRLVLLLWAAWEAAQLCVMYKLRTPLGKPQDTFTNIESK